MDIDTPEARAMLKYWDGIDVDSRGIHLFEIADNITDMLGADALRYFDTANDDLPEDSMLSGLIMSARYIMWVLGIERLE